MLKEIFFLAFMGPFLLTKAQKNVKFLVLLEDGKQADLQNKFSMGIAKAQTENSGFAFEMVPIQVNRDEDEEASLNSSCQVAKSEPFSAAVDLTWGGWDEFKLEAEKNGMPYIRLEGANHQFVQAADDYLHDREAIDAALIFKTEQELDQSLYYLIGNSYIRVIVVNLEEADALDRLAKMRPSPSYYIAHGTTNTIKDIYAKAKERSLVKRDARWTFVFHDWKYNDFPINQLDAQVAFLTMTKADCCTLMNQSGSTCSCTSLSGPAPTFVEMAANLVAKTFVALDTAGKSLLGSMSCGSEAADKSRATAFMSEMEATTAASSKYMIIKDKMLLTYPLQAEVVAKNSSASMAMGTWSTSDGFKKAQGYNHSEIPRFFRIGTVPTTPWAYYEVDDKGSMVKDSEGRPKLKGYCIEMVEEMAQRMKFDYEIVLPTDNSEDYGSRSADGTWSGVIGDLVRGEIDIAVAGMTMTSEREEVVDFVAPYFDQSGISIIIRQPVRPRSLFKFMEVLRVEVWMAILAALVVTALMLWFLDRFSPYSARNNKEAHPYPCRIFTLKESLWFALTSFTPQGGGEAPKSLSGRVLVAAYWLFVVLMLATFTANLAAFLTVERMQTTVAGLEALAQQSKINYSVVDNSPYYEYFKNMASAEEDLYKKWKDMTLSSNADQSRYRVWDYPIKEQYTHIFKTIKSSGMVQSASQGFKKVQEAEDGSFAFIHDASQVRYEYYNNCNFTEVGEPFAEQPYAVAVQQGSHLQEEISRVILELQKDRYFELLSSKYWNSTLRSLCPTLDDSEGITLRSLGGVFIATLVGLGIAMIVLAFEVYFYQKDQKKQSNMVQDISGSDRYGGHYGKDKTVMQVGGRILTVSPIRKTNFGSQFD